MKFRLAIVARAFSPCTYQEHGLKARATGLAILLTFIFAGCRNDDGSNGIQTPVPPAVEAVVKPAPKPTGPLPEGASCVTAECHGDFRTARFIHQPIAAGDCAQCHAADSGAHAFPLKRGLDDTCTFCHAVAGTAAHQHAALATGCTTCHNPHTSRTKFLLTADSTEALCQSCHDKPLQRFAHDPFRKGDCTLCHQPHQSPHPTLLRGGEGPDHCGLCHQPLLDAMATASLVHDPAKKQCTTCHSPHTTAYPHLLSSPVQDTCLSCHEQIGLQIAGARVPHDGVHTAEQCANCHNPHASARTQLLRNRTDKMCLSCHDKTLRTRDNRTVAAMGPVLAESRFLHGPIRQGECSICHAVHGGQRQRLLTAAFPETFYTGFEIDKYDLCFACHDPNLVLSRDTPHLTNFRDGEVNLHYLHVNKDDKGRTCRTCHEIHGSELPYHMARNVRFEGSNWDMPIRFEKTPEGGSCAPGCHAPQHYSRGEQSPHDTTEPGGTP